MKKNLFAFYLLSMAFSSYAQEDYSKLSRIWNPVPRVITPGKTASDPPSDAINLFDGKNFSDWESSNGAAVKWKLDNNTMTVTKDAGNIKTKKGFGDCQLHIEWRTPAQVKGEGQERGNSGIFLWAATNCRYLTAIKIPPIVMDRPAACTSNIFH